MSAELSYEERIVYSSALASVLNISDYQILVDSVGSVTGRGIAISSLISYFYPVVAPDAFSILKSLSSEGLLLSRLKSFALEQSQATADAYANVVVVDPIVLQVIGPACMLALQYF